MKVTILTPVFNSKNHIIPCIDSVISQNYKNIEHILIDGGSSDGTISIIESYGPHIFYFLSEPDHGIYDALNKGLQMASGDVIGVLNSDDCFSSTDVVSAMVNCFKRNDCDAVYGNLNYISRSGLLKITRKWRSKTYTAKDIAYGWMPAHPTLYIKKKIFDSYGGYSIDFGHCGDYELMLRYLFIHKIRAVFLDKLMVNMKRGGVSNGSLMKLFKACKCDYRVLVFCRMPYPLRTLFLKKIRKLNQLF